MQASRNTVQRSIVFLTLQQLCHATADEVYEEIHQNYPTISKGTVYRNLNFLSDSGEIQRISIPDGADVYDKSTHAHYHVKCRICGAVDDIKLEIEDITKKVEISNGFLIESCNVLAMGICPKCRGKI